ncbi:MAG: hypothetical protein K8U57_10205 [Planctomycetes bacterium]|nr:hypothetical protein [Planctomycetota bacterium]
MTEATAVEVEGRVANQIGNRGFFAVVRVRFKSDSASSVTVASDAEDSYGGNEWPAAARFGAALGMAVAEVTGHCRVTGVRGMLVDTNSTLMAIAAMKAVWAAVEFQPTAELVAKVETCVYESRRLSLEQLKAAFGGTGSEDAVNIR